jgi:anti-sigma factor RsiW
MNRHIDDEDLARLVSGETDADESARLRAHVDTCSQCGALARAVTEVDGLLTALPPAGPSPAGLLATRRELTREIGRRGEPEILTLEEVADLLRLRPQEFAEVASELPAFEVGGQIRVRRSRLLAWIGEREHRYRYDVLEGFLTAGPDAGRQLKEGVA